MTEPDAICAGPFSDARDCPVHNPAALRVKTSPVVFTCKATPTSDPPQDCDWPMCGCDPYADKVIVALQEAGKLMTTESERHSWLCPRHPSHPALASLWGDGRCSCGAELIASRSKTLVELARTLDAIDPVGGRGTEGPRAHENLSTVDAPPNDVDTLRQVCAEMYQVAGVLGASEKVLDNLAAAASGKPLPHESVLPYAVDAPPPQAEEPMGKRRLRPAIELVSAIGSLGFDLQFHEQQDIAAAVRLLRTVNPELFDWLVKQLSVRPPRQEGSEP